MLIFLLSVDADRKLPALFPITFCRFGFSCFLSSWRRQQAGDALIQLEQKSHAVGVEGVGFFAAAGLVGGVYGGV